MAIAALYNVPGSPEELAEWSFAHAAHHHDLLAAIQQKFSLTSPEYVLDPFDPQNQQAMGTWIYQHQQMHFTLDAQIGLAGFDLTDIDWTDRGQLAGWIYLNSVEHYNAALILGVG